MCVFFFVYWAKIEIGFWMWRHFSGRVPQQGSQKGTWVDPGSHEQVGCTALTCASVVRFGRDCIRAYSRYFGVDLVELRGLDLSAWRVFTPQSGIGLRWTVQLLSSVRDDILCFCRSRPIRVCNDLIRPLKPIGADLT